jgi:hypothetical protein
VIAVIGKPKLTADKADLKEELKPYRRFARIRRIARNAENADQERLHPAI